MDERVSKPLLEIKQ